MEAAKIGSYAREDLDAIRNRLAGIVCEFLKPYYYEHRMKIKRTIRCVNRTIRKNKNAAQLQFKYLAPTFQDFCDEVLDEFGDFGQYKINLHDQLRYQMLALCSTKVPTDLLRLIWSFMT